MHNSKCFVSVIILITLCFNPVYTQQDVPSISEISDLLGISVLDIINFLAREDNGFPCEDILNSTRDDLCTSQLKIVCGNESFMDKMLDASSKFPYTGMLASSRFDYGSYDECINLDLTEKGVRVIGKHCFSGLIIPTTELNDTDVFDKAYKLSICIPDGCSARDLLDIFNVSSELQVINDEYCSTKESWKVLAAGDYTVIVFLLIIVLVMAISTLYDLYLYYTNQVCPHTLLLAFSVYSNGKKLLQVSQGPSEQIKVIHGLRVISMMWIVTGHASASMTLVPGINVDYPAEFEYTRKSTYITTAHLAVDTFFFLSGFVLAYQYLKQEAGPVKMHLKRIPYLYVHRYLRLTPPVAVAFILSITLLMHMGNGPVYYATIKAEQDKCFEHWWSFFLYLQNYVNYNDVCMINTWYLSADWQLSLISPIILIPAAVLVKRHFNWVMWQLLVVNILCTLIPVGIKFLLNDFDNILETHAYLNDYFIGITLGVFMREKINSKYRFSATGNLVAWALVLVTMVTTTLAYKEMQLLEYFQGPSYSTYFIILRVPWCLGLCWIIYSCQNGYGGAINWLLTTPMVQVLSKLTYCMYVTHLCPIVYILSTARLPVVYREFEGMTISITAYFWTLILSVFWTLAFESPIIILEKYFMRMISRRTPTADVLSPKKETH